MDTMAGGDITADRAYEMILKASGKRAADSFLELSSVPRANGDVSLDTPTKRIMYSNM